jgi:hypothetical protein
MSVGASNPTSSDKRHLLQLPPEIRLIMYGFLPVPNSWRVEIDQGPRFKMSLPRYIPCMDHPLMRTCQTLHRELYDFYSKALPTNPTSLILFSNKEDFALSMLDYFMNSLTDERKKHLKKLVLVPRRNINHERHWRDVITSLLDFNTRLHKYPRITVIVRLYSIEMVSAANWLSATLTMSHMLRFGCGSSYRFDAPVIYHQFHAEAQLRGWNHPPVDRDVRFSMLEEMPKAWIQARCNVTGTACGTQLLKHAESLWMTGKCTCEVCESGLVPCALEILLEEPSARIRSQPPDTTELLRFLPVSTASLSKEISNLGAL